MKPVTAVVLVIGTTQGDRLTEPEAAKKLRVKTDPCSASQFSCDGGKCHDLKIFCDGIRDCADGTDELSCKQKQTSRYRRQFDNYDFGDYGDFDLSGLMTTINPLDFNFMTTALPDFGFGPQTTGAFFDDMLGTTMAPSFNVPTTVVPDFGIATTGLPSFGAATTMPFGGLEATTAPDLGGLATTQPMFDDGLDATTENLDFGPLATTAAGFPDLIATTEALDFPDQATTADNFDDFLVTTQPPSIPLVPTTDQPFPDMMATTEGLDFPLQTTQPAFGPPTQPATTMAAFPDMETTPMNLETQPVTFPQVETTPLALETFPPFPDIVTTQEPLLQTTAGIEDIFPTTPGFGFDQLTTQSDVAKFICRNGKQVLEEQKCNGVDDCGDGSDEEDCFEVVPITTLPTFPEVQTTAGLEGVPTTPGVFFPETFPATTQIAIITEPVPTTLPVFPQATTVDQFPAVTTPPQIRTTIGFGPATTQPGFMPQTTQPPQFGAATTQQVTFNMDTSPPSLPSMSPMGEYNEENFARFMATYQNWRANVFNTWLGTMSLYKRKVNRFTGKPSQTCERPPNARTDCPNSDQECKSDLNGCLYCYCKINKDDDREFIVEEYKRDVTFYEDVLQKQWLDMWDQWEQMWNEYEAEGN